MDIYFLPHFGDQQVDRDDWIYNSQSFDDSLECRKNLAWKLRNKGQWYENDNRDGPASYYCIVNKLQVYCAIKDKDKNGEDIMKIVTTYPYKQSLKKRFAGLTKFNFPKD
jgi:hypothetical protein